MSGRRVRGSGGQSARRAARTKFVIDTAKYIERNIPNFEIMNLESLEIIEEKAEEVLQNIGVKFLDNPSSSSNPLGYAKIYESGTNFLKYSDLKNLTQQTTDAEQKNLDLKSDLDEGDTAKSNSKEVLDAKELSEEIKTK